MITIIVTPVIILPIIPITMTNGLGIFRATKTTIIIVITTPAGVSRLLTVLPVAITQRLAPLRRTTVGRTLEGRLRTAVKKAVADAEAEIPKNPWAEFDAALVAMGNDLERSRRQV